MNDTGSLFDRSESAPEQRQRRLIVDELLLLSDVEKSGRRVRFHPQVTLVQGGNLTGKSSILKSIYWTFGAEPKASDRWRPARVATLARFRIDGVRYCIVRSGGFYAVFDAQDKVLGTFDRVTDGLGPFLAVLLNFQMKHLAKSGKVVTPPPQYYFLPFFVDQDTSWSKNWNSFTRLQQLLRWRKPLAEYHAGLRPNEYFLSKAKRDEELLVAAERERELKVLEALAKRAEQAASHVLFDMDLEAFRHQVEELVAEADKLRQVENALKSRLIDLHDERIQKEQEIRFIEKRRQEASADFDFATSELRGAPIDCPQCGTPFENSFVERLEIAKDEDRLNEMAIQARSELGEIQAGITRQQAKFTNSREEVRKLNLLLQSQMEQITLASLLQNEGRKELRSLLKAKIAEANSSLFTSHRALNCNPPHYSPS
jgi:hypothetical protein